MSVIIPYAKMMHHLTPEEFYEFHLSAVSRIVAHMMHVSRLAVRYDRLNNALIVYDKGFKRSRRAPETKRIRELDIKRRGIFGLIDETVRKLALYSIDEAVVAAANAIIPIMDNYAGAPDIEYEGETGTVNDMLEEFDKPVNVAHIATLGQTANVTALRQINTEFQSLYELRFENRYAFKQGGTTLQRRKALFDEMNNFCEAVNGLLLTASDPDELEALNDIVATINSTIEQYNAIVNRHLGVLAAKKKKHDKEDGKEDGKGDGKEDSQTQTPDITNPPPPNTPQNPDTTNPPAPNLPPQTPNAQPPTIDPDELNPPAVGER